ncbi:hypothetical protein Avbf_14115 [Armadillidium vulgare]|nr:hypothetical protein Avbf_14115 [Armadillidium vulgare]
METKKREERVNKNVPEAVVKLASFLDANNIKEGDDVYFECAITANPKVYKIMWHHNVNAPVCAPDQITTYGVAKKEDAEVTCKVDANPKAKSFKWTFNNTADTIDVPPGRYTTTPQSSIITYTPVTELDFGTLLCWAANDIGVQTIPCVFHIVPAGPSEAEVREGKVNRESSINMIGSSQPSSEDAKIGLNNKMKADEEWQWEVSGIIPLIAGSAAGGILILGLTAILIRHKLKQSRSENIENEDNNSNSHCQSSSASMLFHSRLSAASVACDKRELQIDSGETFDREQMTPTEVDATGPLIQPPVCYAGEGSKNCYRHLQNLEEGSPRHSLISQLHDKGGIVTYHSSSTNLPPGPSYPTRHSYQPNQMQHLMHVKQQQTEFNTISPPPTSLTPPLIRPTFHGDVPTVYATLGARGTRGQGGSLRNAQSQANIDGPYEQETSPQTHATCSRFQRQDSPLGHSAKALKEIRHQDLSRPLLSDNRRQDKNSLNKRESSV